MTGFLRIQAWEGGTSPRQNCTGVETRFGPQTAFEMFEQSPEEVSVMACDHT